jgi:hypothetical protein
MEKPFWTIALHPLVRESFGGFSSGSAACPKINLVK